MDWGCIQAFALAWSPKYCSEWTEFESQTKPLIIYQFNSFLKVNLSTYSWTRIWICVLKFHTFHSMLVVLFVAQKDEREIEREIETER